MTDSPATRTWEPTMRLRWGDRIFPPSGSFPAECYTELEQQWRCLETHETEWRPIEVEP